jgi:hypothetical protein
MSCNLHYEANWQHRMRVYAYTQNCTLQSSKIIILDVSLLPHLYNHLQIFKHTTSIICISNSTQLLNMMNSSSSIGTTTLVGFRPAQLSLSILSRKVLQSAVASSTSNPQLGGEPVILERSNFRNKRSPASEATLANPAAEGGTMGEKWPRILLKVTTSTSLLDKHDELIYIKKSCFLQSAADIE